MNKTTLVVILTMCCLLCGCNHNAENTDAVVVKDLDSDKIVGVLPSKVSRVNGDQNRTPSLLVGAFSPVDNDSGECLIEIKISPVLDSSTLGNVLVKEISLPAVGGTSDTVTVSDLYGILTDLGNKEVLGYFSLGEAFGDSFDGDKEIQFHDRWDSDSTAAFAFPVYVCSDGETFNLRSLMNGSAFHLNEALPEEITCTAIDGKSDAESVPVSSCGIAMFTVSNFEAEHEFSVHLLAFLKLRKESA